MACFSCGSAVFGSRPSVFATLSRAAAKSAGARLRSLGVLRTNVDWTARATMCERCPMRIIAGKTTYCGTPFLEMVKRDETKDGCGCPTIAKAKDPGEHCPINTKHQASTHDGESCDCKWCASQAATLTAAPAPSRDRQRAA